LFDGTSQSKNRRLTLQTTSKNETDVSSNFQLVESITECGKRIQTLEKDRILREEEDTRGRRRRRYLGKGVILREEQDAWR
jgi:hypothetical protein